VTDIKHTKRTTAQVATTDRKIFIMFFQFPFIK
jgi:hypothetical protein